MFAQDTREELFLKQMGAKFSYSNKLRKEDLAPKWDVINLGRSQATAEKVIDEYHRRMQAGSPAPAPILRHTSKGLDVLDGVQRLCAEFRMGSTHFSGYVVKTDSDLLAHMIRVMANSLLQGHPEPADWNRMQAVQLLIIDGGMSAEEVARMGGWLKSDIQKDADYLRVDFQIRCIGGPQAPRGLSKGIVLNIKDHAQENDFKMAGKPIAAFCHDLKNGRFTNGDSEPYIATFFDEVNRKNPKRIHEQFVRQLEAFHKDPEVHIRLEGRRSSPLNAETKLLRQLKSVRTVTKELLHARVQLVYMDEFFQIWKQIQDDLRLLEKQGRNKRAKSKQA